MCHNLCHGYARRNVALGAGMLKWLNFWQERPQKSVFSKWMRRLDALPAGFKTGCVLEFVIEL